MHDVRGGKPRPHETFIALLLGPKPCDHGRKTVHSRLAGPAKHDELHPQKTPIPKGTAGGTFPPRTTGALSARPRILPHSCSHEEMGECVQHAGLRSCAAEVALLTSLAPDQDELRPVRHPH